MWSFDRGRDLASKATAESPTPAVPSDHGPGPSTGIDSGCSPAFGCGGPATPVSLFLTLEPTDAGVMTKKEFQELKEHMDRRFDSMADGYRQLVEFMAPRFDDLGQRLTGVEGRLTDVEGRLTGVEGRLTGVEVLGEKNQHQMEIVAERVTALDGKLEDFRGEVREEFRGVRGEMAVGFEAVRSEMAEGFDAQGKLIRGLGGRVERLEARRA